jgi:hypothetical protein
MKDLLNQPIAESPLSAEFKLAAELFGFHVFGDIIHHRTEYLLRLPGFTRKLLYEYVGYLEKQGYGQYIDP